MEIFLEILPRAHFLEDAFVDVVVVADELFKRERLEHVFRLQVDIFSERETVQHVCV